MESNNLNGRESAIFALLGCDFDVELSQLLLGVGEILFHTYCFKLFLLFERLFIINLFLFCCGSLLLFFLGILILNFVFFFIFIPLLLFLLFLLFFKKLFYIISYLSHFGLVHIHCHISFQPDNFRRTRSEC